MQHCDDLIDDPNQPECLRQFLHYNRLPAACKLAGANPEQVAKLTEYVAAEQRPYVWTAPAPALFAKLRGDETGQVYLGYWKAGKAAMKNVTLKAGQDVRVVMASRFGDVGITNDLNAAHGYILRLPVSALTDFSEKRPEPALT